MTSYNKNRLSAQTARRRYATRMLAGAENALRKPWNVLFPPLLLAMVLLFLCRDWLVSALAPALLVPMLSNMATILIPILSAVIILGLLVVLGTPKGADAMADDLHRAGIVNTIDEPPLLMHRRPDAENPRIEILDFRSVGISRATWEDLQPQVEVALNCHVVKIQDGRFRNRILLHIVPSGAETPKVIYWSEEHTIPDDSTLVLGQAVAGTDVTVDLSKIPHILIGGSTGSGKSVLLKQLLMQCIQKGNQVYIADFKGAVDYGADWERHSSLVVSMDALRPLLAQLVEELETRKQRFRAAGAANLNEYNHMTGKPLQRIIFAADEVAELLDKTGASKALKEEIDQVVGALSTIARQGRAFGIHLILATQRPDANILPGQIKNNIDCRICGRADNVLSQIILDKTDAAELIPKDSHKFLMGDGTLFQPYLLEEGAFQ